MVAGLGKRDSAGNDQMAGEIDSVASNPAVGACGIRWGITTTDTDPEIAGIVAFGDQ